MAAEPQAEPKVEAISSEEEENKTTTDAEATGAQADAGAKGPKHSRSEKKARKAVQRLGLKPVTGVVRVRVKKGKSVLFVINGPEVYKSPTNETTYVIFGEAKMDGDVAGAALSEQANMFKQADGADDDVPELVPSAEAAPEGEVDAETEKHIALVIEQSNCSRAVAIKALQEANNDVVNAILRASSA